MACDILVASEKARFGWAYTAIGLPADMGASYFLPKLAGYHKAMELAFTSDVIDAQEALRLNLVNKVVPHESLMEEAERLAGRLATGALLAIGRVKELINLSYHNPLETQLQLEGEYQRYCSHTEDNKEGVAAFVEKRKPVFKGK
jgi:2-(1,2-epoxy-1,2-dihydrophenyl)acetyl-CoA isomerase